MKFLSDLYFVLIILKGLAFTIETVYPVSKFIFYFILTVIWKSSFTAFNICSNIFWTFWNKVKLASQITDNNNDFGGQEKNVLNNGNSEPRTNAFKRYRKNFKIYREQELKVLQEWFKLNGANSYITENSLIELENNTHFSRKQIQNWIYKKRFSLKQNSF